jgi:hypothetical protein
MPVLGFDTRTTGVESGFKKWPDGWYLLQIEEVKIRPTQKGDQMAHYISKGIESYTPEGKEFEGQKFSDRIMISQKWFGRHMELGAACCGSKAALEQLMSDFDPELLKGKYYYAYIVINGDFNNVNKRIPYTERNRTLIMSNAEPDGIPDVDGTAPAQQATAAQPPAAVAQAPAQAPVQAAPPMQAAPVQAPVQTQPVAAPVQTQAPAPALAPAQAPVQQAAPAAAIPAAPTLATGAPQVVPPPAAPPVPVGGAGIPPAQVPSQ